METEGVQQDTQTDDSQGASGVNEEFYPDLSDVPAEYRQYIDPVIKDMQSNVGKKFEEQANYRKQWEPYEQAGVNEVDPERVQALLQLDRLMNSDDPNDRNELREFYEALGQGYGFTEDGEPGDDDEFDLDESGDEGDSFSAEDLQQLIDQGVQSQLAPFLEHMQAQEQDQAISEADDKISQVLNELGEGKLTEQQEKVICKLALGYEGSPEETLKQGFEEYQSIRGDSQSELFASKEQQPQKPEGPGPANTTPDKITDFKSATAAAKQHLEQAQST
jgi:hypothetical protein